MNAEILQSTLPLDDYDFFLCGPPSFMQALYDMLIKLGVQDPRIFAEAFGPASLKRVAANTGKPARTVPMLAPAEEAVVAFDASGFEQAWTPADGSLLEFPKPTAWRPVLAAVVAAAVVARCA